MRFLKTCRETRARVSLTAGGLLIGTGLFLGAYASLSEPLVSVLVVLYLASGVLLSEATFADKPHFYVIASALLAITIGCSLLASSIMLAPAGACSVIGPILVAWGLREFKEQKVKP